MELKSRSGSRFGNGAEGGRYRAREELRMLRRINKLLSPETYLFPFEKSFLPKFRAVDLYMVIPS